ncbi:MAG: error-prone DNA polymerase [Gammaproteobacteria bacterium]|nr:error-prone DNA polymerase [Gammaproteobacteria bacterium]MDH3448852.1 error-prone DNA polymerase [Gammaproteobacteria bacterium]
MFDQFNEWLCKTNFSFLQGASHPRDLIARANALGYRSLCINDFDGAYGLARCFRELDYLKRQQLHEGLKLNYGAEIHFQRDHDLPVLLQDTLVLVAQNQDGYTNLNRLLSYAHRDGKDYANLPFDELLQADVDGLFAIQPMRGRIRSRHPDTRYAELRTLFDGRFYLAISRHLHPGEDRWIKSTLDIAKAQGLEFILSQDVFFHDRQQKCISDLLQAIRNNRLFDDCHEFYFPNAERCLHHGHELQRLFAAIPDYRRAIGLSQALDESCRFDLDQLGYHYPHEMIPAGHNAQSYLQMLVAEGVQARFEHNPPDKILRQLEHELELIDKLDFADYFLTVWDIVSWARQQQILCQGRGSAANSSVCFVLGITSVNPNQFDLLFERFVSMERGDPPDIDVDFEHERREEVIQYIYRRYGRDRAAMVANVITFRGKGALRAVGKALGADARLLQQMSKVASSRYFRGSGTGNIVMALQNDYEKDNPDAHRINWRLWMQLSEKLHGFPRHLGIHSGGFMLADKPLDCLLPQEPATMQGRSVIQWCKEDIEALGFFKIDVLSLGMLSALRKCFDYVEYYHDRRLRLDSIPDDDQPTYAMIQRAETVGTFQIESRAQMSMLPRLKPACFYDLVIEVAIIRPGPIQGKVIHPFLARREGLEPVTYPDERLRPILERTLGIAIFQEQAMRIAIAVGNFSAGEANELRKKIGSWGVKDFNRDLNPLLVKLEQGMRDNGVKPEFAEQILGQMKGFAEYGFPESHAVSFALIAYASCYLKCHYPAAFYISVLNSQPMGFYSPHALLQSAKREGIRLLPISLNRSEWDHLLERESPRAEFAIRLGFRLINGLAESSVGRIVAKRKLSQGWQSFDDFARDCELARDEITALAASNLFEDFGDSRSDALWKAEAAPLKPLLDDIDDGIDWGSERAMESIRKDFRAFRTSLGPHPAEVIRREQWPYAVAAEKFTRSDRLIQLPADCDVFVFGMVLVKQSPGSAKGMVFVTLEDEAGFINLAFTPQVYTRFYRQVDQQPFLCAVGKLQRVNESHSVLIKRVFDARPGAGLLALRREEQAATPEAAVQLIKPRAFH